MSRMIYSIQRLLINPRPAPIKPLNFKKIFIEVHLFVRKHFFIIFALTVFTLIIIGFLTTSASVYDDINAIVSGDINILEWWRGQPAGWEQNPDSWFSYHDIPIIGSIVGGMSIAQKSDPAALAGDIRGFNGPLNPLAFFTEWYFDYTILVPKLLDLGWVAANIDMPGPMVFKIALSTVFLIVFILLLIPLVAVIAFSIPWIIMFFWHIGSPLVRILIIALPFILVFGYALGWFDFIEEFINSFSLILGDYDYG